MSSVNVSTPRSRTAGASAGAAIARADKRPHSCATDTRALRSRPDENSRPSPRKDDSLNFSGTVSHSSSYDTRTIRSGDAALDHRKGGTPSSEAALPAPLPAGQAPDRTQSQLNVSILSEVAEATVNGLIAGSVAVLRAPLAQQQLYLIPLWVALAITALLITSSLAAIIISLAVASHVDNHITRHAHRDPLPTQTMRKTDPARESTGDSSDSLLLPPLPVHSTPSSFDGDDYSVRLHLPSPRGPAEVLLGLHRAAGTADAALEAAKAAVRGARHAAELAQAARAQRAPGTSPLGGRVRGAAAAHPHTPRLRPPGRRGPPGSPSQLSPELQRHSHAGTPAVDVLLPSPRGPLQVLLERGGHSM